MGKAVQSRDYVIVFNASPETFEDTLLFYHSDIGEALVRNPRIHGQCDDESPACGLPEKVIGVRLDSLQPDGTFLDYFCIKNDRMWSCTFDTPHVPRLVHILHLKETNEIYTHRKLSDWLYRENVAMINPYPKGTANCDSKYRMYEVLRKSDIPTPKSWMISKYDRNKQLLHRKILEQIHESGYFVQPDRGTEGRGCHYVAKKNYKEAEQILNRATEDLVIRIKVGNTLYEQKHLVFRFNVCFDGQGYHAESGYCMVGGTIVSPRHGALKANINRVVEQLAFTEQDIARMRWVSQEAVRSVFLDTLMSGRQPTLLTGVDLVVEHGDDTNRIGTNGFVPYVLDINPRPVVVGSRIVDTDAIGVGEHYWQGVFRL